MKQSIDDQTLKARIHFFWESFADQEPTLRELIDRGETQLASAAINHFLIRLKLPPLATVAKSADGYVLMMCPRGDKTAQLVSRYWAYLAPDTPGWTVQPFGHPTEAELAQLLSAMGMQWDPDAFTVYCVVDDAEQKYQVNAVSPLFSAEHRTESRVFCRTLFFMLLGAAYAELYIGDIACAPAEPNPPFPGTRMTLAEFCDTVRCTPTTRGWLMLKDPTAICYGYHGDEEHGDGMREDIQMGFTRHPQLIDSPFSESEELMHMGGMYCYLYYPTDTADPHAFMEKRAELNGKVEQLMDEYRLGYVLGMAQGSDFCYIDLFVADEPTFSAIFRDTVPLLGEVLDIDYFGRSVSGEWVQ